MVIVSLIIPVNLAVERELRNLSYLKHQYAMLNLRKRCFNWNSAGIV